MLASLATTAVSSAEAARAAERVRIPFPGDDGSLTPYTFELGYPLVTLIYDTLMWRSRNGAPAPWLARSMDKSDAGKTLTIRLPEGVRWHDGRALTAADVAFTYSYFAERFHPRFTPQLEAVRSVEALDAQTVEFTLSHPSPGFSDQPLSDVPILPQHLWEGLPRGASAPEGLPVGSGPYRLVEHRREAGYRFEANRGYFLGRPTVENIDVPFIADFDRTVRALEARRIDMIPATLPQAARDRLRRAEFKTRFGSTYAGTTLMFNLREAPFDEASARRAVASALDLRRIARNETIGGGGGAAVPADRGYLHPGSGWTTPGAVYRLELARARSAFARLKLPQIRVMAPDNDPVAREAGREVVLALQRAGASARLQELSASRLSAAVGEDGGSPSFQAAIWSSPPLASYDPDFLRVEFGSGQAPLNYSGYRSADFDELAERVAAETNPRERRRLVKDEIDLLAQDAPVIPLFFREGAFVFRPSIYDGWTYVAGKGILDKRSFLPLVMRPSTRAPAAPPTPGSQNTDSGIGTLGLVSLGLLSVVLVIVALGLLGRMRSG
ncbi:MAG: ABC transporter substrate-binding protein [Solirubrobacteraceae bacterium MAG38_C4-C5]|nr:ABC transporter substrate-binding protein [Candidatus Siliceabacter maunaloa]